MHRITPNYFRYFTPSAEMPAWGLELSAAGYTYIASGSVYPPARHPADHDFSWSHGRVLEALQIILVTAGRGQLELLRPTKPRAVNAGTAFALLPHVWHRYRPDPEHGWTESWIELRGPIVDNLLATKAFRSDNHVHTDAFAAGLDAALESVHARAREAGPGFEPELAARAYAVLAAWSRSQATAVQPSHMRRAVIAAERHLMERHTEPVNVEALARKLGVAYSHFRRAFRIHTGYAPWKYVLHLRLTQARRLLLSSDATLDHIAAHLGFSSGFHLSAAFKQVYGISPDRWRRQLLGNTYNRSRL
jgi:AraC-like DNA-binding protein